MIRTILTHWKHVCVDFWDSGLARKNTREHEALAFFEETSTPEPLLERSLMTTVLVHPPPSTMPPMMASPRPPSGTYVPPHLRRLRAPSHYEESSAGPSTTMGSESRSIVTFALSPAVVVLIPRATFIEKMGDVREGTNFEVLGGMRQAREMQLLAAHRTWLATKLILRSWQRAIATGRIARSLPDEDAEDAQAKALSSAPKTLQHWLIAERRHDAKLARGKGHGKGSGRCHRVRGAMEDWEEVPQKDGDDVTSV